MDACLLISTVYFQIRGTILAALPLPDLLRCAAVSQLWRRMAAARFSREKCTAYVSRTCKDIYELNCHIMAPRWTLINSLSLHIPKHHQNCYDCLADVDVTSFCDNLENLPLRSLDVFGSCCTATHQILQKIVLGARSTLEELKLTYVVSPVKVFNLGLFKFP